MHFEPAILLARRTNVAGAFSGCAQRRAPLPGTALLAVGVAVPRPCAVTSFFTRRANGFTLIRPLAIAVAGATRPAGHGEFTCTAQLAL